MKVIKNDVVTMLWDAEGFYESRKQGFVAAVNIYNTDSRGDVSVVFMEQTAFLLIDDETGVPVPREEAREAIKEANAEGAIIEEYYEDNYVPLATLAGVDEEVCEMYGLSPENQEDILKRIEDIQGYYAIIEEDMA